MLTSVTAPVLRSSAALRTCWSTAAYSMSVDCTSRSAAASSWKLSTAIPSKPMTEQARAPSTERTTSSSRGRKAISGLGSGRDAGDGHVASGEAAGATVHDLRWRQGGAVHGRGGEAPDGEGEAHLVRVLGASGGQPAEDLEGHQERLGARVDRGAAIDGGERLRLDEVGWHGVFRALSSRGDDGVHVRALGRERDARIRVLVLVDDGIGDEVVPRPRVDDLPPDRERIWLQVVLPSEDLVVAVLDEGRPAGVEGR